MHTRPRIDREDEIMLLHELALGKLTERLFLISAETGMGKSELLREFIITCPKDISVSMIDFKSGAITKSDFIYYICEDLGWEHFPNLENTLRSFLDLPNINVSNNVSFGQNRISVVIRRFDKSMRSIYIHLLTKAFFEDLRNLKRVVLILDTFENASSLLKNWFMNVFLRYARSSSSLAVIISGQDLPEPPLEWMDICHILKLGGIDAIHWYKYAQSIGLTLDLTWFEGCCFAINGHPLRMAQILSIYVELANRR